MKKIISGIMELNLPNKLTLLRMALVPVYLVLLATAVLEVPEDTIGLMAVLFAGAIFLAFIIGVLLALGQRLKEIDGGEEEDAAAAVY